MKTEIPIAALDSNLSGKIYCLQDGGVDDSEEESLCGWSGKTRRTGKGEKTERERTVPNSKAGSASKRAQAEEGRQP